MFNELLNVSLLENIKKLARQPTFVVAPYHIHSTETGGQIEQLNFKSTEKFVTFNSIYIM
jgi:hypothetical protein